MLDMLSLSQAGKHHHWVGVCVAKPLTSTESEALFNACSVLVLLPDLTHRQRHTVVGHTLY